MSLMTRLNELVDQKATQEQNSLIFLGVEGTITHHFFFKVSFKADSNTISLSAISEFPSTRYVTIFLIRISYQLHSTKPLELHCYFQ